MTDKFLGVGGTDGTNARPLKMDVEGNLEVRDIDVKAELELIKNQQSEILSRLGEPIDTQLTGSIVADRYLAVKNITADSTEVQITAGGAHTVEVKPPTGYIWRTPLIWALMPIPTGATTGSTQIEIKNGVDHYRYLVLRARSEADTMTRIMANVAERATHSQLPEDKTTQQNAIQSIVISHDMPLYVTFSNLTDVTYSRYLELRLLVTEERVSS